MENLLRIIILCLGSAFTLTVIGLLTKKKITERNSMLWLLGSLMIFIFSIKPYIIDRIAALIGVDYPPTLLFLAAILTLLLINLHHSIQISLLSAQIREITQWLAVKEILEKEKMTEEKEGNYGYAE